MDATQRALDQQLKAILTIANALKLINIQLKDEDYGSAIIIEYNVIERSIYKMLSVVPEVKKLRFIHDFDRFGLFKEIETLVKATRNNHVLFQELDASFYESIKDWVIRRNTLTHELLEDDRIEDFEENSKALAYEGKTIVKRLIIDLRGIRSRSRNLDHLSYNHQYHLFSGIMMRFEKEEYLKKSR
ncbi:MAG: hypothetical protein KGZ51_07340 [Erysipelothrix sp.]|jgi:hypothetical protein|nr:hypothetical protein [Erysipelothrix sp.]